MDAPFVAFLSLCLSCFTPSKTEREAPAYDRCEYAPDPARDAASKNGDALVREKSSLSMRSSALRICNSAAPSSSLRPKAQARRLSLRAGASIDLITQPFSRLTDRTLLARASTEMLLLLLLQ